MSQMNTGIPQEVKDKIIGILNVLIPKGKIYLFGSRARGTYSEYSDIDLALDIGAQIPLYAINEAKSMLAESNIIYKIDIVDLHRIPEEMKSHIVQEGVLWN